MTVVHQVLSGAGAFDAVTNEALEFRRCFEAWGWGGSDVAARVDDDLSIGLLDDLRPERGDVLLVHYSAFAPLIDRILALPNRKLLLSHNVTPARFLWAHDRAAGVQCALGRQQLPQFVAACDVLAADSAFNAAELRAAGASDVEVLPVLADPSRLGPPGPDHTAPALLFVGRLMPHKRQDDLIRLLALYRAEHAPDATLTLVGSPLNDAYDAHLRALADDLAPGAVTFERGLSPAALADRYRAAGAFVCLSEHEGFCIPVLEALHFGLPVITRPAGAIPEVAGDAALLVDDPDLAVVAELIHLALTDADLRTELRRRGTERVRAFAPERTAAALRALVERALAPSKT